jgi:hypothetical protein
MVTLDKYEPVPIEFQYYSVNINKPCFCYVTKVKNTHMPTIYPRLPNFKNRSQYTIIKQKFKVSNLKWVRHIKDYPQGNMLTMVFTLGNLRSRKISYRLWGEFEGHAFDITPYFRHYHFNQIPNQIPPADINERNYYAGIN